jgi:hypothetical protein
MPRKAALDSGAYYCVGAPASIQSWNDWTSDGERCPPPGIQLP